MVAVWHGYTRRVFFIYYKITFFHAIKVSYKQFIEPVSEVPQASLINLSIANIFKIDGCLLPSFCFIVKLKNTNQKLIPSKYKKVKQ